MYQRYTRALYSHFPSLHRAKTRLERVVRRRLKVPTERDHRVFRFLAERSDAVVLDVGANVGQTVDAVRMHGWRCRLHSFEPNPLLCADLRTAYRTDSRYEVHCVGLGAEQGTFELIIPIYRGLAFHGNASLREEEALGWMNARNIYGFDPARLELRRYDVEIRTLDSFKLDPYFIKLDVQGYEPQVLRGGVETIERSRPVLMIESPKRDAEVAFLEARGYSAFLFDGQRLVPGFAQSLNAFFIPGERVREFPLLIGQS